MGGEEGKKCGGGQGVGRLDVAQAENEEAGRGVSVAEAWKIELKTRRWRVEESLKPPLLGLFDKLEKEELVGDQLLREAFASGGEDLFTRKETKAMIACLENAEARRQQELGMRINKVIESLTGDMELEAMGHQEEELRQFAASYTSYALHQGHTRNHKDYS